MRKYPLLLLMVAVLFAYNSCTKDRAITPVPPACADVNSATNTYTLTIAPMFNNACAQAPCHDAATATHGVDLSTYAATVTAFHNWDVVCSLRGSGCLQMPNVGRPLNDSLIHLVQCWQSNNFPQ